MVLALAGLAGAETYTGEVTSSHSGSTKADWNLTLDGVTWAVHHEGSQSSLYCVRNGGATQNIQFGSANNPITTVSLTTDYFKGKTIESITVNAAKQGQNASVTANVKVDGTEASSAQSVTNTNFTDYTFNPNLTSSENISIVFENSNSTKGNKNGGVKIASITVVYSEGSPLTPVTLAFAQETLEMVVDDMVEAPALTGVPEGVEVTYTSSKPAVATLEDGVVYAYTEGEAVITATTPATETYAAGEATLKVVVTAKPDLRQEAGLSFGDVTEFTTYVEAEDFEAPTLAKATNAAIVYTSSDEDVALVDENDGTIVIGAAGTAVITATAAENDEYKAGTASYTIIVKKIDAALAYSEAAVEKYLNSTEHGDFPVLTNEAAIEVVYASSNERVATVDAEGAVTILAAGNTTISATPANPAKYEGAASYVLTVTDASIVAGGYALVTDVNQLVAGAKIIIVNVENSKSLSENNGENNFPAVDVTMNEDKTTVTDATGVAVFELVVSDGKYAFKKVGTEVDSYLMPASATSSKNYLQLTTSPVYATIALGEGNAAEIKFSQNNSGRNIIRYNPNTGGNNPLFACYASGQKDVHIFIESAGQGVEAPSVEVVFEETGDGEYLADFVYDSENGVVVYYNVASERPAFMAVSKDGLEVTKHTEKVPVVDGDLLTYYAENKGVQSETKQISINKQTTGVENISVDAAAPAEYFDLQGRPVANPANGIFIRRAGSTVTKVAL